MDIAKSDVRWLHISDLHFGSSASYDRDVVLRALEDSLSDLIVRAGNPDIVFVSGDIGNFGKKEDYVQATNFFDKLLKFLALGRDRLVIVPGNHDIDRSGGRFLVRTLLSTDESDEYFSSGEDLVHLKSRQSAFANWYNEFFGGVDSFVESSALMNSRNIDVRGRSVKIQPINTSIFSFDDNDSGKLWVGRRCIDAAALGDGPPQIRIAIMHHPLDWLSQIERPHVKSRLLEGFDFVLTGHLHQNDMDQIQGVAGSACFLAAGATYQGSKWPNTAMFVGVSASNVGVLPIRYDGSSLPCWSVDTSLFRQAGDYIGRFHIGGAGQGGVAQAAVGASTVVGGEPDLALRPTPTKTAFEEDLFLTGSGKPLYAEPRLMRRAQVASISDDGGADRVEIASLIDSNSSFFIEVRSEYGGSTLCKRLEYEFVAAGKSRIYRKNARDIPNYRKKLEAEFPEEIGSVDSGAVLILDNFNPERDERLLKELAGLSIFARLFVVTMDRSLKPSNLLDIADVQFEFERLYLWGVDRADIRSLASTLFESNDVEFIGRIVDKVYQDLLGLCIPLTPSNVVMYLRVLHREGDFHPLNRVDIVGRYLQEALRKPSDAYKDVFNHKNKMDVLSEFVFGMYREQKNDFEARYWFNFIDQYQKRTLLEFNSKEFFDELIESRIFVEWGNVYFLKYSFFFSFFLGRYLSAKPAAMAEFLDKEEYLRIGGVVDVVTGLSSENNELVSRITGHLVGLLEEFSNAYFKADFDPLGRAIWPDDSKEGDELWQPIAKELEAGPRSVKEIDLLKTSLLAEARTADQEVSFSKFTELESAIFLASSILGDALKNSDDISGDLKLKAYDALLRVHQVAFQVGAALAPMLASRRFIRWGSICFIDFDQAVAPGSDRETAMTTIVDAVCSTVAYVSAEDTGAAKLAPVFRAREHDDKSVGFASFVNFNCILFAKGPGWERTLSRIIERTGKNSYYLWAQLNSLMNHLHNTVMQSRDKEHVKRLVAQIQAKRSWMTNAPGERAINKMLGHLEEKKHFDVTPDGNT